MMSEFVFGLHNINTHINGTLGFVLPQIEIIFLQDVFLMLQCNKVIMLHEVIYMTDKQFDEWFQSTIKEDAEATINEIEASEEYKNCKGLSDAAYENLMLKAKEMENGD